MENQDKQAPTQQEPEVQPQQIFLNLEENTPSEEIESLCMNCMKNGKTRYLFTKIPFFKEIIVSSFECPECGYRNNEVQFGGKLADFGVRFTLKVVNPIQMNRNVVKSEYATIKVPELDLEIPPQTQKGTINTVEGYLMKTVEGLSDNQDERRKYDPTTAAKIDEYIAKINEFIDGKRFPFTLILEDPSGNSFIQNPNAPNKDVYMQREDFVRSRDDYIMMGYSPEQADSQNEIDQQKAKELEQRKVLQKKFPHAQTKEEQEEFLQKMKAYAVREPEITASNMDFSKPFDEQVKNNKDEETKQTKQQEDENPQKEVMKFSTYCYSCGLEGNAQMCIANIPYFKEIIIMAFSCDNCGFRTTEVKQGGGISDKATKIVFKVENEKDLNRDVFKSDTCALIIPEVEFSMAPGSLGSHYTTVEGLLDKIITNLEDNNPFGMGDSKQNDEYLKFIGKLKDLKEFKQKFTIILDDALSNCFIYNPQAPESDPQIEVTVYERTFDQNEEFGLNDMKV